MPRVSSEDSDGANARLSRRTGTLQLLQRVLRQVRFLAGIVFLISIVRKCVKQALFPPYEEGFFFVLLEDPFNPRN